MKNMIKQIFVLLLLSGLVACTSSSDKKSDKSEGQKQHRLLNNYEKVTLSPSLSNLTANQKKMLPLLIDAAKIIDELYWLQTCGRKAEMKNKVKNEDLLAYAQINYGPWDRLNNNKPFIDGFKNKPAGANFYPSDMTYEEFEEFNDPEKYSSYTLIRRNEVGGLQCIPYHQAYRSKLEKASELLSEAAELADNEDFANYLELQAAALLVDDYYRSMVTWMKNEDAILDILIGPIDDEEDDLFWTKKTYQSMILLKDKEATADLERYSLLLPYLQKNLPIEEEFLNEPPEELSNIMVYDLIYCSGYWNAASKLITLSMPKDIQVEQEVGSRKLQFKNVMEAKFEKILKPLGEVVIDESQQKHITFNAFFENTMFFEIGSALGLSKTFNGEMSIRHALKDHHNSIMFTKNDILSLFIITKLYDMGELNEGDLMDNYVTYMTNLFRSIRFGVSNDQALSNVIIFYYFQEKEAFTRNDKTDQYMVNKENMRKAMNDMAKELLYIQGEGNYEEAVKLVEEKGYIRDELLNDLYRIQHGNIPKDVAFNQGVEVLEL